MNRRWMIQIDTVCLMAAPSIQLFVQPVEGSGPIGGDLTQLVPPAVAQGCGIDWSVTSRCGS